MAGIIFLLVFIFLLVAILVMPIHFRINHEKDGYFAGRPSLLKLTVDLMAESLVSVKLDVLFIRFTWHPLEKKVKNPAKEKKPSVKKGFRLPDWNRLKFLLSTAWQILRKSKLNKLYLYLDTGNVIVNANLFPVFELMNERPRVNLNINYSGNFDVCLDIQNNLWNVVCIFLYNVIKKYSFLPKTN